MMSLHKLTAGDGYKYLIRQVAAVDATERGRTSLSDYYTAKGETPGRWVGSGLGSLTDTGARWVPTETLTKLWTVDAGSEVTEAQMEALFGEGYHPNAEAISLYVTGRGMHGRAAQNAAKLGREFYIGDDDNEFLRALAKAYREHNNAAGLPGDTPIAAPVRATIRTTIAREKFAEQYGRAPADDRELSGFLARETRTRTTAVAGYDLTFSPVKSVSVLWAVAPMDTAREIEGAHDAAVAESLAWLEGQAALTRSGTNGIAQLDTTGFIGAAFTHRDSRAGDPDLHTHVAISNKVATVDQHGVVRWLALDGQPLHRFGVAASEFYNTRLEAHMVRRVGVRFNEVNSNRRGKRPVREIVGVPAELNDAMSSRRAAITARKADLAKQFHAAHGREPTMAESIALDQQATLETREAKHEPRSLVEQRQAWYTQAVEVLGDVRAVTRMLGATLSTPAQQVEVATDAWISDRAREVIATVSAARATWQRHHVLAEAQRIIRATGHAADTDLAEKISDAALSEPLSVAHARISDGDLSEPELLRRRDGASVYTRHGAAMFTSAEVLSAERRIIAAAHQQSGRAISDADVELALADSAARGKTLNPGQVALVEEMATSGRSLALALAPAGTGKTTAMAALSHAWRTSGGQVIGLAPTAAAAIELSTDLSAPTDTLAKYADLAAGRTLWTAPEWFDQITPETLLIIDEAGKADTLALDAVISHAIARGATVRLVGDDAQLASVSAGGVLRDIAAETDALTLTELVRFVSPAEGAATLALRRGDPMGLGFYVDNGRVHVGAEETAADMAYRSWAADLDAGRDSVLLAPTNDIVDALNERARRDRLAAAEPGTLHGHEIVLADLLHASPGDIIRTRKNARHLRLSRTDFVRNGYRFQIIETHEDGAIDAKHLGTGRMVHLPAKYVKTQVTLGYASTIDSAQGLTAGHACHVVGAGSLFRQLLYVAMTRGRVENHIYLSTAESDPHRVLAPKATHPETAVDVLSKALARDGAQISATTAARDALDPFKRLGPAAEMYDDALGTFAENLAGADTMAAIDAAADELHAGLTGMPAWPTLRKHLATVAVKGRDAVAALQEAAGRRELGTAADMAAVLDWRLDTAGEHSLGIGPLRWLPSIPEQMAAINQWGPYLANRDALITELANDIRAQVASWTPSTAPAWSKPILSANPQLAAEIAVFRAAHNVETEDTRLLGAPQYAARPRKIQLLLEKHAVEAIAQHNPDTRRWERLIDHIDPRIRTDAYWPQLAVRLAQVAPSRPDLATLITTAAEAGPLPDELPAAALWYRLDGELSPIATLDTTHAHLRPPWTRELHNSFGSAAAQAITADEAWPALVAAIAAADPRRWTATDLLHVAAEQLADADPDRTIPTYHYARLITYTVDLLCTPHQASADLPEHPPLSLEEEELLPHDPEAPWIDMSAEPHPYHDVEPWPDQADHPANDASVIDFNDLSRTRPAVPAVPVAVSNVYLLRDQYAATTAHLAALERDVAIFNGPAMRAAAEQISAMRERADADRPYLMAVHEVIAAWADADHDYDEALTFHAWTRDQLAALHADPDADELDITSARGMVELAAMRLGTTPAERYQPQLAAAHAARAEAAGGAQNIISNHDIDNFLAELHARDLEMVDQARYDNQLVRKHLDAAERTVAAAFADAETRTAEHVAAQIDDLDTELRVLDVAGQHQSARALRIAPTATAGLTDNTAAALRSIAELPFTVSIVHAHPDTERTTALHILHSAATDAGRKVLWCGPTEEQAAAAQRDNLADGATTIDAAHAEFTSDSASAMPAGGLIIVDHAQAAQPEQIADLAEHAAQANAGLILIDTSSGTWPPEPADRMMKLLSAELPWNRALTTAPSVATSHAGAPDLDPVVAQLRRVTPDVLTDQLRDALEHADRVRAENLAAYRRHQDANWLRTRSHNQGLQRTQANTVDLTDD